ncbi:MAG: tetratricopeptide repeat protein [Deltaproteobacteria bacterium]|nr:tetratricopeptide repeat protein [Deltaproteobacteria bacterium]
MTLAPLGAAAGPADDPLPAVTDDPPVADPPKGNPGVDQAMAAYQRGRQNYNLAQYEAALSDFQEAASLYASPDFQYNIGLCYEQLGKYDDAIRAFVTYLKTKPDAEDRPNVENRIRELQRDLERQERNGTGGTVVTPPPPLEDSPPPEDEEAPTSPGRGLIIAGAALAGVGGVVALGGGIAFGVLARNRGDAVNGVQFGGNPDDLTFSQAEALDAEGRRFEAIQIGMVAAGAAVAVTGAVLLAVGLRKRNSAKNPAPSAWIAPGMAGLALTGRF